MSPEGPAQPWRLLVAGGSTAAGLGARGRPFPRRAAELLGGPELLDLSRSGRLIDETLDHVDDIRRFRPDVALVALGGSESVVHPGPVAKRLIERYAPTSWHGVGGLQPRAYYSTDPARRCRQRVVSWLKVALKHVLIPLTRGGPRMAPEVFGRHLDELLTVLEQAGCATVVLGLWPIDERLFPGTPACFARTEREIVRVTSEHRSASFVDFGSELRVWDDYLDDRLHLNDDGHARVAALVAARLGTMLEDRAATPLREAG